MMDLSLSNIDGKSLVDGAKMAANDTLLRCMGISNYKAFDDDSGDKGASGDTEAPRTSFMIPRTLLAVDGYFTIKSLFDTLIDRIKKCSICNGSCDSLYVVKNYATSPICTECAKTQKEINLVIQIKENRMKIWRCRMD